MKIFIPLFLLCCLTQTKAQDYNTFKIFEDSAKTNIRNSEFDKGWTFLKKMDSISATIKNDSLLMRVNDNYAFYHFLEGNYEKSVEFLSEATDLAEKLKYWDSYLDMKNNLGMIHSKLENYNKSRVAYLNVLKKTEQEGLEVDEDYASTLINLGSSLQSLGNFKKADSIFDSGIRLSKKFKNKELVAAALKFKAKNNLMKEQYQKVLTIVDTIELYYFDQIAPRLKDDPIFHRAKANYFLKNFNQAEEDIQLAIQLMNNHKNDPSIVEKIEFQSKVREAQGKFKSALALQRKANKIKDSIDIVRMNSKVLEIEEKYKAEKKEKENLVLKQEASLKDLTIAEKNNLILFGSLIFAAIIGLLVVYQLQRLNKKNKALEESIERREQVEKELEIVRDNIAKDFHDEMGNRMARITALSDLMIQSRDIKNKKDMVNALKGIKEDSDELYKGTRDFMFSLKPESDGLEEVVTYLSDFGQDYLQSFDIDFFVEKSYSKAIKLPYYWNRQIILIFKEAITNTAKHAQADVATFVAIVDNNILKMSFTDNGTGFIVENLHRKNGLLNMKSRAEKINGLLEVESTEDGSNITLKAHLPV